MTKPLDNPKPGPPPPLTDGRSKALLADRCPWLLHPAHLMADDDSLNGGIKKSPHKFFFSLARVQYREATPIKPSKYSIEDADELLINARGGAVCVAV